MVISRTATFLFILFTLSVQSQTFISGGDVAGTWKAEGNPYIITDNVVVNVADRLKIEPGVVVQFEALSAILVYGHLEAFGNENDSITFTSADTTGYSSGNFMGWFGLAFLGQGSGQNEPSLLKYCNIEFSMGSGITCMQYDNLEIAHSHFRNNLSYGMSIWEYSDINVQFVEASNNSLGGMDIQYSAPHIQNFEVKNNGGAGISFVGATLGNQPAILSQGIIHNNFSSENGGGISMNMEARVEMNDINIYSNTAVYGGGIYCAYSFLNASKLNISTNRAVKGAGIFAGYDAQIETDHSLIINNAASQSGGAVYVLDSEFEMLFSTISNNRAAISGGGFFFDLINNTPNHLSSCIVWQNYPDEIIATSNVPELDFCDVKGGFAGAYNINADPLFEDADKDNYHLSWISYPYLNDGKSPCIDAANPHFGYDQDETVVDMGAFYFSQTLTITQVETKQIAEKAGLYPNPVTTSFHINGIEELKNVTVCNLSGQVVKTFESVNPQSSYDVADLHPGIYLVRLTFASGSIESHKIIRK